MGGVWGVATMDNDLEGFHSRGLGVWWMIVIWSVATSTRCVEVAFPFGKH